METLEKKTITVEALINAPVEKVWKFWTEPFHIMHWNNASDDWQTTLAENDLKVGGKFLSRMEAKDGSMGFDFEGIYEEVVPQQRIVYRLLDDRKVIILFNEHEGKTTLTETFEADISHSLEMQQGGWQAILNNFKKHVETTTTHPLHYEVLIDAPVEKVYRIMLDEEQYKVWTKAFSPTSHYQGSWEKGSKILFIGSDDNGVTGGMVSRIKENIPNKFVSIEHLGVTQNGQEITSGPEVNSWAGALENYSYREAEGKTLLAIDVDSNEQFEGYFKETWPKALASLKAACEA